MTKKNKQIVTIAAAIVILGTLTTIWATTAGVPTIRPIPTESPTPIILEPPTPIATFSLPTERDDISVADIEMLAKTVWGEARGCSPDEWRLVVWCVFQRVDSPDYDFRNQNTISDVITHPNAFTGYRDEYPIDPDIYAVCREEWHKWQEDEESFTLEPYATETPYLFFKGDGKHNWYRREWR